ncbi:MAG: hypothetical protein AAF849_04900 [Bacteroidota bacterium]
MNTNNLKKAIACTTPDIVNTKYGKRVVVKVNCDGQEKKIWGDLNNGLLLSLKIGQVVTVEPSGKNLKIVQSSQTIVSNAPTPSKSYVPISKSVKLEVVNFITDSAKLYRYCFDQATETMSEHSLPDDSLRAIATTLYLQTQKKFNL